MVAILSKSWKETVLFCWVGWNNESPEGFIHHGLSAFSLV